MVPHRLSLQRLSFHLFISIFLMSCLPLTLHFLSRSFRNLWNLLKSSSRVWLVLCDHEGDNLSNSCCPCCSFWGVLGFFFFVFSFCFICIVLGFEFEVLLVVDLGIRVHGFVYLICFGVALMSFFRICVLFFVLLKCMPDSTLSCLVAQKMEERKRKEMKNCLIVYNMGGFSSSGTLEEMNLFLVEVMTSSWLSSCLICFFFFFFSFPFLGS